SSDQNRTTEKRTREKGYQDKIVVLLCDYRNHVPVKRYDKICSIEMVESVRKAFLPTYFKVIDQLLKADGGIAVIQGITMPETRYEQYSKGVGLIRKFVALITFIKS
ncbi:Tuberculostearic acid methyltransferase UfaA1, partial [Neolecta irregularis DAH-3]